MREWEGYIQQGNRFKDLNGNIYFRIGSASRYCYWCPTFLCIFCAMFHAEKQNFIKAIREECELRNRRSGVWKKAFLWQIQHFRSSISVAARSINSGGKVIVQTAHFRSSCTILWMQDKNIYNKVYQKILTFPFCFCSLSNYVCVKSTSTWKINSNLHVVGRRIPITFSLC